MTMYNESQKLEYIAYAEKNEKILTNRFKQFGKYEELYKKDLCEMNIDELKSVFSALNIVTPLTRLNTKSLINGYIDWCIRNHKTNKPNALKLLLTDDILSTNALETKMLKSPEQVRVILEKAYGKDDNNIYPNKIVLSKLIVWLFYSGISENDLQELKKDSIDYNRKIVYSPTQVNVVYEVFEEVIPLWQQFVNLNEIEFTGVRGSTSRVHTLIDNEYLFRQFETNKINKHEHMQPHVFRSYLRNVFVKYQEETGIHLLVSISNMALSGYFYRLYISEKFDIEIKEEIFELNGTNNIKATSMFDNFLEWRKYFYDI